MELFVLSLRHSTDRLPLQKGIVRSLGVNDVALVLVEFDIERLPCNGCITGICPDAFEFELSPLL